MTIRNPLEWGYDQLRLTASGVDVALHAFHAAKETPAPAIRRIGMADLGSALAAGIEDFGRYRTDVLFLCILYPIFGLVLGRLVVGQGMFALLFPLVSGFALIGPFIALGLYEMSRRHELGMRASWTDAFRVLGAHSSGAIAMLGLILMAVFIVWLFAAEAIYQATLGPQQPASIAAFVGDVFTTGAGWALIAAGIGVGFLFALVVLTTTVVSFPLLLDRQDVRIDVAVGTSVRAVLANKGPMAAWGLIIAASLAIGSIPFLLGLAFVIPILGHATWHLYRRVVAR